MANKSLPTVLITGGTGSFGRRFAEIALKKNLFEKVIIFSRDEWKQWEMASEPPFKHPKIRFFLGDVRDKDRLSRAFKEVDIVIHAAALKQIVTAEYNPSEFIKTNILGMMNVLEAATDSGIQKVLILSTDKSVNPVNLYGATKLCQDKLAVAANSYAGRAKKPLFSVVRYGNVAGTRGSLIPFWQQLLLEGTEELPITDIRMTRFWITLDEAVYFVLKKLDVMRGGEIFVPKLPSFYIKDIKDALAPQAKLIPVGIRPGEKLHELLISQEEARHTLEFSDHFGIYPEFTFRSDLPSFEKMALEKKGKPLKESFTYISNRNSHWLSTKDLKKQLADLR